MKNQNSALHSSVVLSYSETKLPRDEPEPLSVQTETAPPADCPATPTHRSRALPGTPAQATSRPCHKPRLPHHPLCGQHCDSSTTHHSVAPDPAFALQDKDAYVRPKPPARAAA